MILLPCCWCQSENHSDKVLDYKLAKPQTASFIARLFTDDGVRTIVRGKSGSKIVEANVRTPEELAWYLGVRHEFAGDTHYIGGTENTYRMYRHPGTGEESQLAGGSRLGDLLIFSSEERDYAQVFDQLKSPRQIKAIIWAAETTNIEDLQSGFEAKMRAGMSVNGHNKVDFDWDIDARAAYVRSELESESSDFLLISGVVVSGRKMSIARSDVKQEEDTVITRDGVVSTTLRSRTQGLTLDVTLFCQDDGKTWIGFIDYHDGRFVSDTDDVQVDLQIPVVLLAGESRVTSVDRRGARTEKRGPFHWLKFRTRRSEKRELAVGIWLESFH